MGQWPGMPSLLHTSRLNSNLSSKIQLIAYRPQEASDALAGECPSVGLPGRALNTAPPVLYPVTDYEPLWEGTLGNHFLNSGSCTAQHRIVDTLIPSSRTHSVAVIRSQFRRQHRVIVRSPASVDMVPIWVLPSLPNLPGCLGQGSFSPSASCGPSCG